VRSDDAEKLALDDYFVDFHQRVVARVIIDASDLLFDM
jgi:hypothetical protein